MSFDAASDTWIVRELVPSDTHGLLLHDANEKSVRTINKRERERENDSVSFCTLITD